jgi:hypothetical protein
MMHIALSQLENCSLVSQAVPSNPAWCMTGLSPDGKRRDLTPPNISDSTSPLDGGKRVLTVGKIYESYLSGDRPFDHPLDQSL